MRIKPFRASYPQLAEADAFVVCLEKRHCLLSGPALLRRCRGSTEVAYDLHAGDCDQSLSHHGVEMRNQVIDPSRRVDDAQHDRSIPGERPIVAVANPGTRAVTFDATINNGSSHFQFLTFGENRFMKRPALPLILFAEMDAQHAPFELLFHGSSPIFAEPPAGSAVRSSSSAR